MSERGVVRQLAMTASSTSYPKTSFPNRDGQCMGERCQIAIDRRVGTRGRTTVREFVTRFRNQRRRQISEDTVTQLCFPPGKSKCLHVDRGVTFARQIFMHEAVNHL